MLAGKPLRSILAAHSSRRRYDEQSSRFDDETRASAARDDRAAPTSALVNGIETFKLQLTRLVHWRGERPSASPAHISSSRPRNDGSQIGEKGVDSAVGADQRLDPVVVVIQFGDRDATHETKRVAK